MWTVIGDEKNYFNIKDFLKINGETSNLNFLIIENINIFDISLPQQMTYFAHHLTIFDLFHPV